MSTDGDWWVPAGSLTLPPFAGPDTAAIVIGPDLPTCMQATYSSAIFWRPPGTSLAAGSAPTFFIAQRLVPIGGGGWQTIDQGFVVDDGVNCGYEVIQRVRAQTQLPAYNLDINIQIGKLEVIGIIPIGTPAPRVNITSDVSITSQNIAPGFGSYMSKNYFVDGRAACFSTVNQNALVNSNVTANVINAWTGYANAFVTIDKEYGAGVSNLRCRFCPTYFVSDTNTDTEFGVLVGGTDYVTSRRYGVVPTGLRITSAGEFDITGLAAGLNISVAGRFRIVGGVGTANIVNGDDSFTLTVEEVPVPT